ncbi:hypothetical protein F5Y12DRAFT_343704 [Xylaria sp. FL1777]|nr:hypothetical protein F5Y12DRAFT_343704 [Xylaria sp. FL1777]
MMPVQSPRLYTEVLLEVSQHLSTQSKANLGAANKEIWEALGSQLLRETLLKEKEQFLFKYVYSTKAMIHFASSGFARKFDTVKHVAITCRTGEWTHDMDVAPLDVLKLYCEIDTLDSSHRTVLSSLVTTQHNPGPAVEALLAAGADPNGGPDRGPDMPTPISILFSPGRFTLYSWMEAGPILLRCVKALVRHGASTTPHPHGTEFLMVVLITIWEKLCLVARHAAGFGTLTHLSGPSHKRQLILALERVETQPYDELCDILVDATPAWQELVPGARGNVRMLMLLDRIPMEEFHFQPKSLYGMTDGLFRERDRICRFGVAFSVSEQRWWVNYPML